MKKITKPDPKQARSVVTFTYCKCWVCSDCNSTSSQAIALGLGAQADYDFHMSEAHRQ